MTMLRRTAILGMENITLRDARAPVAAGVGIVTDFEDPAADRRRRGLEKGVDVVPVNRLAAVEAEHAAHRRQPVQDVGPRGRGHG